MTVTQQFKSAIKRGTGEAHLVMKAHPGVDFSREIIKAALKDLSYDNQAEGSRANYIFELIALSNQKKKIRAAILNGLKTEQTDAWALHQLFELAALFAKQGDKEARQAVYKRFCKKIIKGADWMGEAAILEIDGLEGLHHIAVTKGKLIQKNPEHWEDGYTADAFQKENPTIKVYQQLEKAAKTNTFIRSYLDAIKEYKAGVQQRGKRKKYNYAIVTERINNYPTFRFFPMAAKDLSKKDIQKLANDFLQQTDRVKQERYMQVFDRIKYPYDYQAILTLVKSKNKKSDRLVQYAAGALQYFSGADIRAFAIEKLNKVRIPFIYLDLLVSNYKEGDAKLLTAIVNRCKNEHEIHLLVYGIIAIYKANSTPECKKVLEAVYNKLTCGIHRTDIVKIMLDNKVLSGKLKKEIRFDCAEDTRKLLSA